MSLLTNFFDQNAAIRPQKIDHKAAAAKRPHFAHGWLKYFLFILGAESKVADTSGESEGLAVSKEQVTNIKSEDDKTGTCGFALDASNE